MEQKRGLVNNLDLLKKEKRKQKHKKLITSLYLIVLDHGLQFVLLIILLLQFHNSCRDWTYLLCEALVSRHKSPSTFPIVQHSIRSLFSLALHPRNKTCCNKGDDPTRINTRVPSRPDPEPSPGNGIVPFPRLSGREFPGKREILIPTHG